MKMTHIKAIFGTFIGTLAILYLFYNRLFRERWPIDLVQPISNTRLFFCVCIILINLLLLIVLLYSKYKTPNNKDTVLKRISSYINAKISFFVRNLGQRYLDIVAFIPNYQGFLLNCIQSYSRITLNIRRIFILLLLVLPRTIVLSAFLLDIFVFHKFYYFYKVIWLLLIPLLIMFILFVLKDIYCGAMSGLMKDIDIIPINGVAFQILDSKMEHVNMSSIVLKEGSSASWDYVNYQYDFLEGFHEAIYNTIILRDNINFYIGVAMRIFYIIGWTYIIYLGSLGFTSFPFYF